MNEKEVAELRRRLKPETCGIKRIRGCYVSNQREMISTFDQSMGLLPQEEQEKYLSLFKRTMSGTLGKNLMDISFSTGQVVDSDEHRLLSALRSSALEDEDAVQALYEKIISSVSLGENYLILLSCDTYDVPFRSKDGVLQPDAGEEQYTYILCSICPVKMSKPALRYESAQREFHNRGADWVVAAPEIGFLFPAFDDRRTNLYGALYYCRDAAASYDELIDAVFHTPAPMPAAAQKQTFHAVLADALQEDCSLCVVQAVHEQLSDMITAHKEAKLDEPLVISRGDVNTVLKDCGISEQHMAAFNVKFDEAFGNGSALSPRNLIDEKRYELRTPEVVIHVNPERRDLVQTRVIGGVNYILINADAGVEVNGIPIRPEEAAEKKETGAPAANGT